MSSHDREESLFSDSTMSFGEHIEELRSALAKALVGLAIGIGIAFFFADDAVQWIEKPLKDGLTQFYVSKATTDFAADLTPEQLNLITGDRMAPEELHIEAEMLWNRLRDIYPEKIPDVDVQKYDILASDIKTSIPEIAAALSSDHRKGTFAALVSAQLNKSQREQLTKIVTGTATEKDAKTVATILNAIVRKPALVTETTDKMVNRLFPSNEQRLAIKQLIENAEANPHLVPRTNRFLLASAFAPHVPPTKPKFLRLITWKPVETSIQTLRAEEAFMTWFKAAFVLGAVISAPWVFYQLWMFVAAGLYPHEKNYVHMYLPFSLVLFFAGAGMAFFFVFPYVLKFLFSFNQMIGVDVKPRLNEWLSFALFLPLGFGISFQLPLVMLLLERIGVTSIDMYLKKWRIAVLVIAILSMLLTPADPTSMLLMGVPLIVLYFGGIGLCKWMPKRKSPQGEGYDP